MNESAPEDKSLPPLLNALEDRLYNRIRKKKGPMHIPRTELDRAGHRQKIDSVADYIDLK